MRRELLRGPRRAGRKVAPEPHFHNECSCVPRPIFSDYLVFRSRQRAVAGEPVQFRSIVVWRSSPRQYGQLLFTRNGLSQYQRARRLNSAIEIHRSQNGLKRIHQQALLVASASRFFAMTKAQMTPQIKPVRRSQQMRRAHKVVLEERKLTFGEIGKA